MRARHIPLEGSEVPPPVGHGPGRRRRLGLGRLGCGRRCGFHGGSRWRWRCRGRCTAGGGQREQREKGENTVHGLGPVSCEMSRRTGAATRRIDWNQGVFCASSRALISSRSTAAPRRYTVARSCMAASWSASSSRVVETCMCVLTGAGMTVVPARSTRAAPSGTYTSLRGPTCVIHPLSTTIAAS